MEPILKRLLIAQFLLLSTLAFADLMEDHGKICASPEVKTIIGETGSCRIVLVPKSIKKAGSCTGRFQGTMTCLVKFDSESKESKMNLKCDDGSDTLIEQDMDGDFQGYNLTTILKTSDGKDIVKEDKNNYIVISNRMLSLQVIEGEKDSTARVMMDLGDQKVDLENVTCGN